jgi:hypothetical protein
VVARRAGGWIGVVGGLVALVLVLVGVAYAVSHSGGTSPGFGGAAATATPGILAKGASATTSNGYQCTFVSAQVVSGDGILDPDPGDEFVEVDVTLENGSGTTQSYNEFDFQIESSAGNITGPTVPPSTVTTDLLNNGDLAPGGHVTGAVVFELPTGDQNGKLIWFPDPSANGYTWSLGL